jgi:hypothetical protein
MNDTLKLAFIPVSQGDRLDPFTLVVQISSVGYTGNKLLAMLMHKFK